MIEYEDYMPNKAYFAAANGFTGFRSYFNKIFEPTNFERIYILKGGPGTGKSTIMKGLIKYANNAGISSEAIYCSSDPYSLDGAILTDNERSVLVVDGTSPHCVEAVYPGVIERIIDLGTGFDIKYLSEKRNKIINLTMNKKSAYKRGYDYLRAAGIIYRSIYDEYAKQVDLDALESVCKNLLYTNHSQKCSIKREENYLISAFGKFGFIRIDNIQTHYPETIFISGNGFTDAIIMNKLSEMLCETSCVKAICPSPFSDDITDAIICDGCAYVSEGSNAEDPYGILKIKPNTETQISVYNSLIKLSEEAFSEASEYHFKLENIYQQGIEFTNNDKTFADLIESIEKDID